MNIYVDLIAKQAITSPTDSTPAVRPDFSAPTTYPINLYFLRQTGTGGYGYVRFPNSVILAGVRSAAPVEVARFTLIFRGVETSEIDTRFSTDQIRKLLEALPTVGVGNVLVRRGANSLFNDGSLVVEFVGALAGMVLPTMSARVVSSTPTDAELGIEVLPVTPSAANSTQQLSLRRPLLAQTSTWTEVTTGTTPGWTGTLNTTAVPISEWENPVGDIRFEVTLTALSTRSASDGATVNDTVGRSGANGQVLASPGASGVFAKMSDSDTDSFLIASDGSGVYGRKFVPNDIGRGVTDSDGYVWAGTTVVEVTDDGITNMARLSQRYTTKGIGLGDLIVYSLGALPSDIYYSATANFTVADVGHVIVGGNIPIDTRIAAVITAQYVRLSQRPTAIGVALSWNLLGEISNVFTSSSGVFQSGDVGATLRAPAVLDGDATITKFISSTQVTLDRQPNGTQVSVPWTIIPVRPYPPALVSRLITGSASAQEVQKIALAQAAIGGAIAIQDGYGGTMPVATINNPVSTSDLQIALRQAYTNYGDLSVQEVVPGAEWNVIFGKAGGQRLLTVDESAAIYEGAVLNWIVADESPRAPALPMLPAIAPTIVRANGLCYIGADPNNVGALQVIGRPRVSRITDGTNALSCRLRVMMFTDYWNSLGMNQTFAWNGHTYYFVGEEGGQDRNGIYSVDLVLATLPAQRMEVHNQQRTIMIPLYQLRGNQVIDVQLISTSASTWAYVYFNYWLEGNFGIPPDSPIGVVVHYSTVGGVEFVPTLWYANGFNPSVGNWGLQFVQSWSRRRWMGHIWEQKQIYN